MIVNGQYIPTPPDRMARNKLAYSTSNSIYVPTTRIGKLKALVDIILHNVRRLLNDNS